QVNGADNRAGNGARLDHVDQQIGSVVFLLLFGPGELVNRNLTDVNGYLGRRDNVSQGWYGLGSFRRQFTSFLGGLGRVQGSFLESYPCRAGTDGFGFAVSATTGATGASVVLAGVY